MHPHWELPGNVYKPDELLEKARILNCSVKTVNWSSGNNSGN